jgi:hypothetical protein
MQSVDFYPVDFIPQAQPVRMSGGKTTIAVCHRIKCKERLFSARGMPTPRAHTDAVLP